MSLKCHYENFLAENYLWAFGTHEENAEKFRRLMERMNIAPGNASCAVDLGCGPGYQSVALEESGFKVIAVDSSAVLLEELRLRVNNESVTVVEDDILNFQSHCDGIDVELIICVGDVLAHMATMADVEALLKSAYEALAHGGKLLIAFRDQTKELMGADRIIPFHSDENKIMTTFLEFSEENVKVTDVIYERAGQSWRLIKSEYQKIRLRTEKVKTMLAAAGFNVSEEEQSDGFTNILAIK